MQACSGIMCQTGAACCATHACMQSHKPPQGLVCGCMRSHMLLHMFYLPHTHACSCKIHRTGMHARHSVPYRQVCSCKHLQIPPHMFYVPHKHKCICIIMQLQVVSSTQAGIHLHNMSHTYARNCRFCYTSCVCHTCSRIICYASWVCPIGKHAVV